MIETRSAEHWNERYVGGDLPWDTQQAERRFVEVVGELQPPTRRAMDLGCGTGTNALWLGREGFETIGIDIAAAAVERARQRAREAGLEQVRFACASVLDPLPVEPGTIGVATDRGCFHTVGADDRPRYAQRVAEALAAGGWWVMICGSADEIRAEGEHGPPQLTAGQIAAAVEPRFEVHRLERSSFTGSDDRPTHIAWRGVLRRR